jgi:hypothetical protein
MIRPIAPSFAPAPHNRLKPLVPILYRLKPYRKRPSAKLRLCRAIIAFFLAIFALLFIAFSSL